MPQTETDYPPSSFICQWFVPLSQLRQPGGAALTPLRGLGADGRSSHSGDDGTFEQWIEPGSPCTLSLESFCINEALDRRSGNDLLARSWTVYGNAPPVEMIHCFERNVVEGKVIDNLAIEHMFALESFDPEQALDIHVQILEVDGHESLADELNHVAQALGGVFPTLLPFTSVAIPLYRQLKSMFAKQQRTVEAFTGSCKLSGPMDNTVQSEQASIQAGHRFLQAGAYVLVQEPVDGGQYRLQDLKLIPADDRTAPPPSYVVIKVVPQLVQSYNPDDVLVNQQLAAALLNPTHADELREPEIIQRLKEKVQSLPYLQKAAQKALLLDDLREYRRLRQLQKDEPHPGESPRDRLLRMERLQALKHRLAQDAFLPAIAHLKKTLS